MTKNFHPPNSRRGEARGCREKTRERVDAEGQDRTGPSCAGTDGGWQRKLEIGRVIMH